ncbi:MAG: ATP-binding cassette domain-containing protein [Hydrotalea flava]|uniref:peptidase domain-containing ABC transporter n=1 Tax=Hydrotalea lipotrueae TaxID=2803817 RepID=UPI001691CDD7|nr:peptidase domain-containing ABC transporter [Hydrotalea lipotrueae]NIM36322.1 ATP-binding cassette domain-containing protein [Hydrotalea flava]NIM39177.1 ATP-binding cassette domain-containing protein [Hydrotalea flava]NIN04416.1 ATP-binding cassette domain-containing protein [Hydrotalea flava]NIN16034.1 ATP-binding cassette domain-containing protein [Hydrotalea flava]NIO95103.1 ATP-binding cassette domain-containing protein [Hydrotalea flava]
MLLSLKKSIRQIPSIVQQQDQKDCGVACLLSLIRYYGGDNDFENLRRLSGTTITGTTLLGLFQAAQATGFDAEGCEADMEALLTHPSPCILHVLLENRLQHYVVYFGTTIKKDKQLLIVGDPSKGIVHYTPDELEAIWQSRACLVLTPNGSFQKTKDIVSNKKQWFKELIKQDAPLLMIAAVMGIAIAALGLTMSIFSQRLIDEFLPRKQYNKLYTGIGLVFFLLMAKESVTLLRTHLLIRQSKEFNLRITKEFFSRLLYLPKSFFDTRKIGDLTARLHDTNRIQRVLSQIVGNTLLDAIVVLVTLVFVFSYSVFSGFITLAALPVFFLLIYRSNKKISEAQQSTMAGYAMAESNYISTLQGVEAIKNHSKEPLFSEGNHTVYNNYQSSIFQLGKIQMRLTFVANVFAASLLCSLLLFLSNSVLHNQLKVGELMAIIGMVGSLLPSVANLALLSIPINEARIAFNRMYEFVGIQYKEAGIEELTHFERLEVKQVLFRYPGRSPVLQNISFSVQKGEVIALMGENGCGKSTLVQLLMQHYTAESGTILVNGNFNLYNIEKKRWGKLAAVVPQQVHIFNGTILENIAFDDAANNPEAVAEFLRNYGFAPYMDSLPQSVMTLVGEEGINLSGGQKQMIALARALYHRPQLLLLDEATSAMDRETERFVLHLLQQLKTQMAIVMITHRLHVLKTFCDRIYLLDKGFIHTAGNHDTLLLTNNLYSRYWADMVD